MWIDCMLRNNTLVLIPVAVGLPTPTPVCSEERPKMVPSITGRPLICQSATSSAGENPFVVNPSPNFCFRFLLAKIRTWLRFILTITQQTENQTLDALTTLHNVLVFNLDLLPGTFYVVGVGTEGKKAKK